MRKILFINPPVVSVNECQVGWYSFAHPTSILKLITWQKLQGNEVAFIDCMEYESEINENSFKPYKKLPLGTNSLNLYIDTYILGKPISWLENELKKQSSPDEVWISCHMTFNNELAHGAVRAARKVFPKSIIRLGGNYAALFPEEAGISGATVHKGLFAGAEMLFPDYSLFHGPMDYIVFQLDLGCNNHCSHCVNRMLKQGIVRFDVKALVEDLKLKKELYGVSHFIKDLCPNKLHKCLE